jgi:hypothetical protein
MNILLRAYFCKKNFQKKFGRKLIRPESGSDQKSSGSATLAEVLRMLNFCLENIVAECETKKFVNQIKLKYKYKRIMLNLSWASSTSTQFVSLPKLR